MAGPGVLVAGAEPLGLATAERLVASGAEVTVLAAASEAARYAHALERIGARLVVGSARSAGELLAAGLETAAALVLTSDDEAENIDAALAARRLRPDLPMVVRLFDSELSDYLRRTVKSVMILSMSGVAAPVLADLALRCLEESRGRPAPPRRRRRRRRRPGAWRLDVDRVLAVAALAPVVLLIPSTLYFTHALDVRPLDALYFVWTTIFTVGYGDISLRQASDIAKIAGMGLMLVGASFVAILYALLSSWVVARRLEVLSGRVPVHARGHVIIAGAGNVGYRVAKILGEKGCRVVIVERDTTSRNVNDLKADGHHVIIADAAVHETLDLAALERAALVMALTNSDATNLHVALTARAERPDIRVVVRLLSQELSAHVAERGDALTVSSVDIASAEFARAALAACGARR